MFGKKSHVCPVCRKRDFEDNLHKCRDWKYRRTEKIRWLHVECILANKSQYGRRLADYVTKNVSLTGRRATDVEPNTTKRKQ